MRRRLNDIIGEELSSVAFANSLVLTAERERGFTNKAAQSEVSSPSCVELLLYNHEALLCQSAHTEITR